MSLRSTLAFSFALVAVAACAAPPQPSGFGDRESSGDGTGDGTTGGLGGSSDESGSQSTPDDFNSCATSSAAAEAKPVYLVFMFDKSGSMVNSGSPKWSSAKAASKSFFESPESKGVNASLSFFPDKSNYSCSVGAYNTPKVSMSALPSTSFGDSLDQQSPAGGTPTYVAMQGAIQYAQQVQQNEGKDGTVAIVLVTDGLPDSDCNGNSVSSVKQLASSVAQTLPTYVIGVGSALGNLNDIASGGGTKDALIVQTNNPSQIQTDFLAAIQKIKNSALSCDYKIPAPPNGEELDRNKVNVLYTPTGAGAETLEHNQSCAGGKGWRYDDENNPSQIIMCTGSCDDIKAKPGKVDVLFGCATKSTGVK